jgi:lipopolysaccharide transport system permease protein
MSRLVIEAGRAEKHYWADLWRYRELFYILAWRDVAVRYKQTVAGIAWALLQPLITLVVFTVIFSVFAKLPSEGGAPYIIMVAAAQLPWQFFANALSGSSQSLVGNAQLISKVYFPRLIIPVGAVVTSLIDFLISFVILIALMVWFQYWPTWRLLVLPPLVLLAFLASLGPGLLLTALTVKYRDFRVVLPFLVQLGTYVSPVGFSSSVVPEQWRLLYSLNPMVAVIEGFRWAILAGKSPVYWPGVGLSLGVAAAMLVLGIWYFRKTERVFADVI